MKFRNSDFCVIAFLNNSTEDIFLLYTLPPGIRLYLTLFIYLFIYFHLLTVWSPKMSGFWWMWGNSGVSCSTSHLSGTMSEWVMREMISHGHTDWSTDRAGINQRARHHHSDTNYTALRDHRHSGPGFPMSIVLEPFICSWGTGKCHSGTENL